MGAIVYLLQVSACMGLFYVFYFFRLSRLTFFTINRWYLLLSMLISFAIPKLTFHVKNDYRYVNMMNTVQHVQVIENRPNLSGQISHAVVVEQFNWLPLLQIMYMLVAVTLFGH